MAKILLEENERIDDLLFNNLKIVQNKNLYCFTSDAVLLANFVKAKKSDEIVDLCSGSGIVGILSQAKTDAKFVHLVEMQPEMCSMANKTIVMDNLEDKAKVYNIKVQNAVDVLGREKFAVVVSNPPYRLSEAHFLPEEQHINICKYEIELSLDELIKSASELLKFGGKFFFVHDSSRLADIITTLRKYNLEPKRLEFAFPSNKSSNVVLVEALKGGKAGLIINQKNI